MPTENPKISAYVPQVVYDRFKQFQEERGLSMSQAAIEVFAEYFGINLADSSTKENTGGLLDRVVQLEQIVSELKQSYFYLCQRVDSSQPAGELLKDRLDANSTNSRSELLVDLPSESPNEIPKVDLVGELSGEPQGDLLEDVESVLGNGLPSEPQGDLLEDVESVLGNGLPSEPQGDLPIQLGLESIEDQVVVSISIDELLSELPIDTEVKPLKLSALAKQLGLSDAMLHKVRKYDINKQIEYTSSKSLEKRPWVFSDSAKLFYPLRISERLSSFGS